ncbi:MAG TPA: hypothetical protein VGH89_28375 [Pseudonocardia sp.]|jgi:hypothetical protein
MPPRTSASERREAHEQRKARIVGLRRPPSVSADVAATEVATDVEADLER